MSSRITLSDGTNVTSSFTNSSSLVKKVGKSLVSLLACTNTIKARTQIHIYCCLMSRCEKALTKRNLVSKENIRPTGTLYSSTRCFQRWTSL